MRTFLSAPVLAATLVAAGSSSSSLSAQATPWQPGERLPHVHLPTLEGEEIDLADYRGQKLLLIEFASW